jgi:hypothetical protein
MARPEDQLQQAAHAYLHAVLPGDAYYTFVDKAGKRSRISGVQLARRGIKSGVADCLLWRQGMGYWIELKSAVGRLQDTQKAEFPKAQAAGVQISVCRSVADIERALIHWGIPLRGTTLTAQERDGRMADRVEKPRKAAAPRAQKPSKRALAFAARAQAFGGGK